MSSPAPVHIYWANPARPAGLLHLLDELELERLATLRKPDDKARYVTSHALTRLVVAQHAGLDDSRVVFNRTCSLCGGPHGKPHVSAPGGGERTTVPTWHVSLSHSADVVLAAITTLGPVGIDVETVEGSGFEGFDTVALSRSEATKLARFPSVRRPRAQAVWWTRKEAVLKATGDGLTVAPQRIVVSAPDEEPELLRWKGEGGPTQPAQLFDLDLGSSYAAAVCVMAEQRPPLELHQGNEILGLAAQHG